MNTDLERPEARSCSPIHDAFGEVIEALRASSSLFGRSSLQSLLCWKNGAFEGRKKRAAVAAEIV